MTTVEELTEERDGCMQNTTRLFERGWMPKLSWN